MPRHQLLRRHLEELMQMDTRLSCTSKEVFDKRIDRFYLPVFEWVEKVVNLAKQKGQKCVCLGLSCVQGGGKTTLSKYLEKMFIFTGKKCTVISIDDVYLTRKDQIQLATQNPTNQLLQYRGNPGTHDMNLLMDFVRKCKTSDQNSVIPVPQYDKSLHNGRGDRVTIDKWERKQGPIDVLLIEGWCMGFCPLSADQILDENLKSVNQKLYAFEDFYKELDALVVIKVAAPELVYKWREEAEQHLRDQGKPAMTSVEVRDFCDRFMPAYQTYLPGLYSSKILDKSSPLASLPRLILEIDAQRSPVDARPVELNFHMK